MILKVPDRTPQKVKLRNTVSTLGTSFRDPFADLFGKMLTKRESQIEARSRPLGHLLTWFWDVTCSHVRDHLTGTGITFTLRAACFAGHSLVNRVVLLNVFYEPHNSANIRMRYLIRIRQVDVDPRRVFEKHPLFTIKTQPISDMPCNRRSGSQSAENTKQETLKQNVCNHKARLKSRGMYS